MSEYFPEITPTTEDEQIARMLLLMGLQSVYRASVETDDDSLRAAVKARQAGMSMEPEVFVSPQFTEHAALPGNSHDRMVWKPKPEQDIHGLKQIIARLPIPTPTFETETNGNTEDDTSLNEPTTMPVWNDIFIELVYKDGTFQRVLLNSRGIMPYRDKSDVQEIKKETRKIEEEARGSNQQGPLDRFAVTTSDERSTSINADKLTVLIRSCNLQRQKLTRLK